MKSGNWINLLGICAAISVLATGSAVVQILRFFGGPDYVRTEQLRRHEAVLSGLAGDPWAYRWLSELLVVPLLEISQLASGDVLWGFLTFRILQNFVIGSLLWLWLRRLGIAASARWIGLALFFYASMNAVFDSDLSLNTYADVAFILATALLVSSGNPFLASLLLVVAVHNRETVLIGALLMLVFLPGSLKRRILWTLLALVSALASYLLARRFIGERELIRPYDIEPGLEVAVFNLRLESAQELTITFLPIVLLALAGWRKASKKLRLAVGVILVPWIVIHFFGSLVAESRLFLAMAAAVLIPIALSPFTEWNRHETVQPSKDHLR
jgi:hypothetical protein